MVINFINILRKPNVWVNIRIPCTRLNMVILGKHMKSLKRKFYVETMFRRKNYVLITLWASQIYANYRTILPITSICTCRQCRFPLMGSDIKQMDTIPWRHNGRDGVSKPASPLFTQPFIQAPIKEIIKAAHHWPLCGEFAGDRWIPRTNGQ